MTVRKVMRFGRFVPCDRVFSATASGDLDRMLAVLQVETNPIERHYLLQTALDLTIRRSKKAEATDEAVMYLAELHWSELPQLLREMQRHEQLSRAARQAPPMPFELPAVTSVGCLIRAYERSNRPSDAARVLEQWNQLRADLMRGSDAI